MNRSLDGDCIHPLHWGIDAQMGRTCDFATLDHKERLSTISRETAVPTKDFYKTNVGTSSFSVR